MKLPGIFITLLGASISGVTSIILSYNSNPVIYTFLVLGIVITTLGSYLQYTESETIRIKIDFKKDDSGENRYVCLIPYSTYKKRNPFIMQVNRNNEPIWGFGYKILQNGDISISIDSSIEEDCFLLIK